MTESIGREFRSRRRSIYIGNVTTPCANCGCIGARSYLVHKCAQVECCCADTPLQTMEMLAARVRSAMESADLTAMSELLAPDARWGAPEQKVPTCRNAQQIISWYEMARDNGVRADVTEVNVLGDHIVLGLKIHADPKDPNRSKDQVRWQVLSVRDGRVAEIRGYEKHRDATTYATTGISNWT